MVTANPWDILCSNTAARGLANNGNDLVQVFVDADFRNDAAEAEVRLDLSMRSQMKGSRDHREPRPQLSHRMMFRYLIQSMSGHKEAQKSQGDKVG